jgi:hypothetical protein
MKVVFQYKDKDGKDQELTEHVDVPRLHDKVRISNWPKSEEYFTVVNIIWTLNNNDIGHDEPEVVIQLKRATSDWLGL